MMKPPTTAVNRPRSGDAPEAIAIGRFPTISPDGRHVACHYSEEGEEEPCIGYVAQEGWSNLSIRMMVIRGDLDMAAIMDACADLELWPDFDTMLEDYEEAADG